MLAMLTFSATEILTFFLNKVSAVEVVAFHVNVQKFKLTGAFIE